LVAFGEQGIEQGDEIEALGNLPQSGNVAAGGDQSFEGLRGNLSLLSGGNDVFNFAEVDLADDFGLASTRWQ
jgi:hypothetical protein